MDIHGFIRLPHRFRWGGIGGDDCMTFVGRWAEEVTGRDPVAELRGTYASRAQSIAVIADFGGYDRLIDERLRLCGARRLTLAEPHRDGDIGLVQVETADETGQPYLAHVGAIAFGPLWISIAPGGVRGTRARRIAAWRLLP